MSQAVAAVRRPQAPPGRRTRRRWYHRRPHLVGRCRVSEFPAIAEDAPARQRCRVVRRSATVARDRSSSTQPSTQSVKGVVRHPQVAVSGLRAIITGAFKAPQLDRCRGWSPLTKDMSPSGPTRCRRPCLSGVGSAPKAHGSLSAAVGIQIDLDRGCLVIIAAHGTHMAGEKLLHGPIACARF